MVTKRLLYAFGYVCKHKIKQFDFPDYGGINPKISYKLTTDEVDVIQEAIYLKITKIKDFINYAKGKL